MRPKQIFSVNTQFNNNFCCNLSDRPSVIWLMVQLVYMYIYANSI